MAARSIPQIRCFGPFRLDLETGELWKSGTKIRLQGQSVRILLCLLEEPGRFRTREELRSRLWSKATFVDFDHSLNVAVNRLRERLGDSAENAHYIETVPGIGYRFVVPVEANQPASSEVLPPAECQRNARQGSSLIARIPEAPAIPLAKQIVPAPKGGRAQALASKRVRVLITAAAAIVVATVIVYFRSVPDGTIYSAVPLTTYLGSQLCPSFSPEGDRVVFAWDGDKQDNFDIYVKQMGVAVPSRLTTDPRPEMSPAWSPDGRTIAFLRFLSSIKAELVLTPSLGSGPERRLLEVAAPNNRSKWRLKLLSWSADSKWLIVPDARWPDGPMGLFLVSVETGEKRRLTQTARYDDLEPAFSPDMRRVAFARYSGAGTSCIYVLELSNHLDPVGQPKQLTFSPGDNRSPVWMPEGRMLLFSQQGGAGKPSLWYMTVSKNARARPLPLATDNATGIAASPAGDRLIYTRSAVNSNIWAFETSGGPLWTDHNRSPRPWITSSFQEGTPAFSPDGRQIAVQSNRSGWNEIWVHNRDGSHARQLTDLKGGTAGFPHWSPDGKKIVFHSRRGGNTGEAILYMVEVATGRSTRILTAGVNEQVTPSWSRDSKWIYFSSRQSGAYEVSKVSGEGGIATQITRNGGCYPSESADGKQLFYTKVDNSLWRMPVDGGIEQRLVSDVAADGSLFAVAKSGIYFIREPAAGAERQLGFYSFASEKLEVLADIPRPVNMGLAVSPDEKLLLYPQIDQVGSNLMLIENFRLTRNPDNGQLNSKR